MSRAKKNLSLLRLAGLYGLVHLHDAEDIFEGKDFSALFNTAPWRDYLCRHHKKAGDALPGGVSYITATPAGMIHEGFSRDRFSNNSQAALVQRHAVAWFCRDDPKNRRCLLLPDDAAKLLAADLPTNVAFALAVEQKRPVVYRIYVSSTDTPGTLNQLRSIIDEMEKNPDLAKRVALKNLGVAVLAETPEKVTEIRDAIHRGKAPLTNRIRIRVGFFPSLDGLADTLKEKRRRKGK